MQKYKKTGNAHVKKEVLIVLQNLVKCQVTKEICDIAQSFAEECLSNCKDTKAQEEANNLLKQLEQAAIYEFTEQADLK